ncbi:dermonecrotic toxin domain-containing protein [Pseudomonas sp. 1152_12]|uniref:dermonecrotic toxin domain-containing protein n=1 Tax=Pseudomonas sp. 1152_12 TaxID=2604455 RepID=UPI00406328FD
MPHDTPATDSSQNNRPPDAYELLTQLTSVPTTREVASTTLRTALRELYPALDIDPDLAMVCRPSWRVVGDTIVSSSGYPESLTSVLARQAVSPKPVIYLDGEHYLSLQPEDVNAVHLPVKIDAVGRLINELSPLLFTSFQEQQLDYWNQSNGDNGPRWQVFANSLSKVWNVTTVEGWDADDCAMARTLYHAPQWETRTLKDPYKSRAYLIDVDLLHDDQSRHVSVLDRAVLIGTHEEKPKILVYSLVGGYEKFDSLEALGESLPSKVTEASGDMRLQWRLSEPVGNFFDSLACALISIQIDTIGDLSNAEGNAPLELAQAPSTLTRSLPSIEDLNDQSLANIRQMHQHIPDWLAEANDADVAAYSRHLIDLSQVHTYNQGCSFHDGIAPIRDYARTQLQRKFQGHKQGAQLNPNKIEVIIRSPVIWGSFTVPGQVDITRRNLIDLTLENLTGLPTGDKSVVYNGGATPDWLTYSYLEEVITQLDIGEQYPALVKRTLLEDSQQSHARRLLYASQVRVQLPLLALQWKIQARNGLTELGYRYVAAVMQTEAHDRQVDGQEIVIRPLAFIPTLRPGHEQDVVTNMFVIGPKSADRGPCLLYRPLLEPALRQFPTRQNLLYAIKHDRPLRESVLAWLPEAARFNYAQYVFPDTLPSPWTLVRVLIEPATVVYMSGPIVLSDDALGNDVLDTLFKANANAMVELATRQSVSNVKKRWATYRQAGWRIFNAALPYLGPTVGVAAWMWQIMSDLEEAEKAINAPDEPTPWTSLVDLWLNLGMALALHVALRHPPTQATAEPLKIKMADEPVLITEPQQPELPAPTVTRVQMPELSSTELFASHQKSLHVSGALSRSPSTLNTRLESLKIDRPTDLGEQNKQTGPHLHLYPSENKWFAPVGKRWFEVQVDADDNVMIIDPLIPSRTGPLLIGNKAGQWFVDTRLRLRGGGLRNRRKAAKGPRPARIDDLREKLEKFRLSEPDHQKKLSDALAAIGSQPGPSTDARRQTFITEVDKRLLEYEEPIRQLRALGIIDAVPNYQSLMINYMKNQLMLTEAAIDEQLPAYRDTLLAALDMLQSTEPLDPAIEMQTAQGMATQSLEIIMRLEYVANRIKELENLGAEGAKVIQSTLRALPNIKLADLKAVLITVSQYLCVNTGDSELLTRVRTQLNAIVDVADLNVQSVIDILGLPHNNTLNERIEALNSLAEQFSVVDQRLLDLHADYAEQLQRAPLEVLRQRIDEFHQQTLSELAQLLRERKALEPKPGPSKPPERPRRKIIKTRFKGVVVGEPRENDATLVDVKAPLTGKLIATFHEKNPGNWVEHKATTAPAPTSKTTDLGVSLNAGQQLLDEDRAVTQRLLAHSRRPGRIPVEIEEMFHQHAARLESAAMEVETALTQLNLTESDRPSAATLNRRLNDGARRFYELGTQTRITMTKQQPPTAARVEWLHAQGLVKIAKVINRRRRKGPGKDYLDEYEIRDSQSQSVLWYAHFHYAAPKTEVEYFTAAHLKTREQRKLGGAVQRIGTSDKDQIAIYRSEISPQLARSVFFEA